MASQKDVFSDLDTINDNWWDKAKKANNWKTRFPLVKQVIESLESPEGLPQQFQPNEKSFSIYTQLLEWLNTEKHVFTRAKILDLLPTFINSLPRDELHANNLATTITTKLWPELQNKYHSKCQSILIQLWLKTNFSLITPGFADGLINAMKHKKKQLQLLSFQFLTKCTMFPERKMNIIDLMVKRTSNDNDEKKNNDDENSNDENIIHILIDIINNAKLYVTRLAAAQVFHGLISTLAIENINNQTIDNIVESINNESILIRASQDYDKEKKEFLTDHSLPNDDGKDDEKDESKHQDRESRWDASRIFKEIESQNQLHIWDYVNAAWIPLKKALATQKKRKIVTKSVMISKKFGGLDPAEILMYQSIENHCNNVWELTMPHDLLMVILLYSQGYKFEKGDHCIFFPSGVFGDSGHGIIRDILEDKIKKNSYKYLVKNKAGGGPLRVPFNHVFGDKIVIIDEEAFKVAYEGIYDKLKYGDVLEVRRLECEQEKVYSKKKKREISKLKLKMVCRQMVDTRWKPKGKKTGYKWRKQQEQHNIVIPKASYRSVEIAWDGNIFVQAKWKRIDS